MIELKDMLRTEVAEAVPSFELGLAYTGTVVPQLMTGVHSLLEEAVEGGCVVV